MSDYDDYDEDEIVSLDDVAEDELKEDSSKGNDWDDNSDDMDSGEWGNQYGYTDDDLGEDDIDPWALN